MRDTSQDNTPRHGLRFEQQQVTTTTESSRSSDLDSLSQFEISGREQFGELDAEAQIRALSDRVASADFEIKVLGEIEKRLAKSDLAPQGFFHRLNRLTSIDDPELGLLPNRTFDIARADIRASDLHPLAPAIMLGYLFAAVPWATSHFLGGYIPGPGWTDAIVGIGSVLLSTSLATSEKSLLSSIGKAGEFIAMLPLELPTRIIQGAKSIVAGLTGFMSEENDLKRAVANRLDKMLAPIRAQKLSSSQRAAAREELIMSVGKRADELYTQIAPDRAALDALVSDRNRTTEIEARLRELEVTRKETQTVSDAVEQARRVIEQGVELQQAPHPEIAPSPIEGSPLFSDLARFSGDELRTLKAALSDEDEFLTLAQSSSPAIAILVSDLLKNFSGPDLIIAKRFLGSQVEAFLEATAG